MHVGDALAALAQNRPELVALPPLDSRRVTIVATASPDIWTQLDHLRETQTLTWDILVRSAIDLAGSGGDAL